MGVFLIPPLLAVKAIATDRFQAPPETGSNAVPLPAPRSPNRSANPNQSSSFFSDRNPVSENQLLKQLPDPTLSPDPTLPSDPIFSHWQPIFLPEGGLECRMPPGTLTEETVVLPTRLGEVSFHTLATNFEEARYVVAYADQLTEKQLEKPQALLTAIINRVISAQNFNLVQNLPTRLSISLGRELSYESDTDVIVFRAYLIRNRAYIIGARTPKSEEIPSPRIVNFLKSFQFVNL